jgi:hypothetical protein
MQNRRDENEHKSERRHACDMLHHNTDPRCPTSPQGLISKVEPASTPNLPSETAPKGVPLRKPPVKS